MQNIELMLYDGMIGPKSVMVALSALTTGNLNAKMKQGSKPFTIKDVLPMAHEYVFPPATEQEQRAAVSTQLLAFISMAPDADKYLGG